ncbi:MAG: MarC family protein [Kiritimatiellae bacterium]|nr:MarC family protein [Kiritimatiellia bacterium]MDD5520368.1 MarC family protein [Kiritimatiellia bacterium]
MKDFWLCFVPLFVAVDALGVLPVFISLTEGLGEQKIRRIVLQSVITAAAVALTFLAIGTGILNLLGITVSDFMIAGGVLLFVISMSDLITAAKSRGVIDLECLGAVPIGVPLITGPAVLTTSILLLNEHGIIPTAPAILVNIFIAGVVFHYSGTIFRFLGKAGAKTISKLASLLLAAIGVMMVRKGVVMIVALTH